MKAWTYKEILYLENKWGQTSITSIANHLNRTINSVKTKAYKIGLRRFIDQGTYITFSQLVKVLGYSGNNQFLEKRLIKLDFPIKSKTPLNMKYKIVYIDEFWEWVENHKKDISFAKLEKGILGKEPDWVDEKRKADIKNPSKLTYKRKWTNEEDKLLESKLKLYKYTYADLSEEFNRTEAAIKRRIYDLALPYRPVRRDNHIKWTDEENRKMIELHDKGFDDFFIAKTLNKTELSISNRLNNNKIKVR